MSGGAPTGGSSRLDGVTLALLAGGAGSRMGVPKDRVTIEGVGPVPWILRRTSWLGPTMLVGPADRRPVLGQDLVDRVVWDDAEGQGPVCGVRTALRSCSTDELVIVPVDMPGLEGTHLRWLVAHGRPTGAACAMLRRGPGEERVEPFPAYFRARFLQAPCWNATGKGRSMRALSRDPMATVLPAPSWPNAVWTNLNTPEDAAAFERVVRGPDPPND